MKLNIGSGGCCMLEGYLNIDNLSDYSDPMDMMIEVINTMTGCEYDDGSYKKTAFMYVEDANDLSMFDDEQFEEIHSNQCVGIYVTNYDEMVRVLKMGGTVKFGVWGHKVGEVLQGLIERNIKITSVKWFNGCVGDDPEDITMMIEGVKVKDEGECCY